ncbi:hypothetical protein [Kutzneria buriramensis]|nr:hypothetical protein [Kutzneria buriramensis]
MGIPFRTNAVGDCVMNSVRKNARVAGLGLAAFLVAVAGAACDSSPATGSSAPTSTTSAPTTTTTAATTTSTTGTAATTTSATSPAAQPVLGRVARPGEKGYGAARPGQIDNGGDGTGVVDNVTWQSWGGATAMGTGTAFYSPPGGDLAHGFEAPATVQAFDLGMCDGKPAYRSLEWFFPGQGGKFDPKNVLNACP